MSTPLQKFVAEGIGTFALVFIGAGVVIVESHTGPSHLEVTDGKVGLVGIALAHGAILTAMIYAVGGASGGHFNPAVSFAAWLQQRLDANLLAGYVMAQLVAAVAAGVLLAVLFPDEMSLASLGTPTLAPRITPLKGILFEAVITFILVTAILLGTRKEGGAGSLAGLAIGGTLVAIILFAGPLTGAAANPARYLGPALVSGNLSEIAVYLFGPFAGACGAALLTGVMVRGRAIPSFDHEDAYEGHEEGAYDGAPEPATAEVHVVREKRAEAEADDRRPGRSGEDLRDPEDGYDDSGRGSGFWTPLWSDWWPKRRPALAPAGQGRRGRGSKHGPPEARLQRAYELFESGQFEVAASLAKPLLGEQDFSERARALLIVIEDELA